jgi:hypothetical protein
MVALAAGIPTVFVTSDLRTEELALSCGIPYIRSAIFTGSENIETTVQNLWSSWTPNHMIEAQKKIRKVYDYMLGLNDSYE